MSRLSRFIRLSFAFKLLLAEAFLRLSAISILLHAAPRSYRLNRLRNSKEQAPGWSKFGYDDSDERSGRSPRPLSANSRNEGAFQRTVSPAKVSHGCTNTAQARDICKAVVIAARYVPGSTCLVQCLTGRAMMRRVACVAEIKIGVLKDSSNFHAHAWLQNEDSVLLGGEIKQYTELGNLPHATPKT